MELTHEAYKKLPVAKANTHIDLECISVQRDLINEPVTLHTSDGQAYRVESGKIDKMAREALKLTLEGRAPDDTGPGRLFDILQGVLDSAPKVEQATSTPEQAAPTQVIPTLNTIVDELADKIAAQFEEALKKALQRRHKDILLNVTEVLLG